MKSVSGSIASVAVLLMLSGQLLAQESAANGQEANADAPLQPGNAASGVQRGRSIPGSSGSSGGGSDRAGDTGQLGAGGSTPNTRGSTDGGAMSATESAQEGGEAEPPTLPGGVGVNTSGQELIDK
jgi:hypothetical protein